MHLPYGSTSERKFSDLLLVPGALPSDGVRDSKRQSYRSLYSTTIIPMQHPVERDMRTLLPDTVVIFEDWGFRDSDHGVHCTRIE